MDEVFLRIEDYDDYYVSNLGRVLNTNFNHTGEEKFIRPKINNDGYCCVVLYNETGPKEFLVHRLVANAFIPNQNNYPQVNHIDEIKIHNFINNLEWCTEKYNTQYSQAKRVGCYDKDWNLIKEYDSIHDCELDGHSNQHVSKCCNNKPGYYTHHGYRWKFID